MKLGSGILLGAVLTIVIQAGIQAIAARPLDDTDSPAGQRSNMELLTDHGTGCQYLLSEGGGLTPRLDASGKHICVPKGGANAG